MTRIRMTSLRSLLVAAILLFPVPYTPALADDLSDAQQLARQGKNTEALELINKYLVKHPKDAQAQFQKGLILTEQNNTTEAIKVFSDLTRDYPSLPEPYNNLAVLYFSQGQYEKARAALEAAIRTHPAYATAHENLGDIYAKMASQAYDRALQLDKSNTTAQTKLALVKELFTTTGNSIHPQPVKPNAGTSPAPSVAQNLVKPTPAAAPMPARPTAPSAQPSVSGPEPSAAPASSKPATLPATQAGSHAPTAPLGKIAAVTPKTVPIPEQKPAIEETARPNSEQKAEVLKTLNGWAKAWSDRNARAYLSYYAKDFKTPKGEKRSNWESSRRERITKPKSIQVAIVAPEVTLHDATHATASFRQIYHSDALKSSTRKTLVLAKSGEKWVILEEKVGH